MSRPFQPRRVTRWPARSASSALPKSTGRPFSRRPHHRHRIVAIRAVAGPEIRVAHLGRTLHAVAPGHMCRAEVLAVTMFGARVHQTTPPGADHPTNVPQLPHRPLWTRDFGCAQSASAATTPSFRERDGALTAGTETGAETPSRGACDARYASSTSAGSAAVRSDRSSSITTDTPERRSNHASAIPRSITDSSRYTVTRRLLMHRTLRPGSTVRQVGRVRTTLERNTGNMPGKVS